MKNMDQAQIILHLGGEDKMDLILSYNTQIHFSNYIKEYLIAENIITKKEDIKFDIEFEKGSIKYVVTVIVPVLTALSLLVALPDGVSKLMLLPKQHKLAALTLDNEINEEEQKQESLKASEKYSKPAYQFWHDLATSPDQRDYVEISAKKGLEIKSLGKVEKKDYEKHANHWKEEKNDIKEEIITEIFETSMKTKNSIKYNNEYISLSENQINKIRVNSKDGYILPHEIQATLKIIKEKNQKDKYEIIEVSKKPDNDQPNLFV